MVGLLVRSRSVCAVHGGRRHHGDVAQSEFDRLLLTFAQGHPGARIGVAGRTRPKLVRSWVGWNGYPEESSGQLHIVAEQLDRGPLRGRHRDDDGWDARFEQRQFSSGLLLRILKRSGCRLVDLFVHDLQIGLSSSHEMSELYFCSSDVEKVGWCMNDALCAREVIHGLSIATVVEGLDAR